MNIIAIDTATEKFSLAISTRKNGNRETWLFEVDAGMRHSELAMEGVDILMRKAGLRPGDVDGVTCLGGPGSFTGLRIGFSMAKGLALSLGVPFAPIPTLDCMARPLSCWPGMAIPVLDAKKRAFFCAFYMEGNRIGPEMDATPGEIAAAIAKTISTKAVEQVLLFGPGAEVLFRELSTLTENDGEVAGIMSVIRCGNGIRWGNAQTMLEMAEVVFSESGEAELRKNLDAGPEYIRKSDAEIDLLERQGTE